MVAFNRMTVCMSYVFLAFSLFLHQSILAHGGDSHDVSPTQLLDMKAHDLDHEEHGHSRFSYIIVGSSSQPMRAEEKNSDAHESTLVDRHQLTGSINYHLSDIWALSLSGGAGGESGVQDPSLGPSATLPIAGTQFQFIGLTSIAPAVSVHSREQGRVATFNMFMGMGTTVSRWTVGFFGGAAFPAYRAPAKEEEHGQEDSHDPSHREARERVRTSGALKAAYKLSKSFKLDSSYDLALINKHQISSYASELMVSRLSYMEKGWQAGIAFVLQDESGVFRMPLKPIARVTVTVLR